jgi:hypothetical protein
MVFVGPLEDECLGELAGVHPMALPQQLVDGLPADAQPLADFPVAQALLA